MASAGKISSRRSIFIVSSVVLVESILAVTLRFVEHPLQHRDGLRMMLHCLPKRTSAKRCHATRIATHRRRRGAREFAGGSVPAGFSVIGVGAIDRGARWESREWRHDWTDVGHKLSTTAQFLPLAEHLRMDPTSKVFSRKPDF